jgi:hypothetical protein
VAISSTGGPAGGGPIAALKTTVGATATSLAVAVGIKAIHRMVRTERGTS